MRPGRIDRLIYVRLPDSATRLAILRLLLGRHFKDLAPLDLPSLVLRTEGFSGAEIVSLVERALDAAMSDFLRSEGGRSEAKMLPEDVQAALCDIRPRTRPEHLKMYDEFCDSSGQSTVGFWEKNESQRIFYALTIKAIKMVIFYNFFTQSSVIFQNFWM